MSYRTTINYSYSTLKKHPSPLQLFFRPLYLFFLLLALLLLFTSLPSCVPQNITPQSKALSPASLESSNTFSKYSASSWPQIAWWKVYDDAQLNALAQKALAQSPSIALANARIRKAMGAAQTAGASILPQIDATGQAAYTRFSAEAYSPPEIAGFGHETTDAKALLSLSYTLDLWGKNQASYTAGLNELAAEAASAQEARLLLTSSVVRAYISLARQYALLDVARRTLTQREGELRLAKKLLAAGMGTELDVSQAEVPIPVYKAKIVAVLASISSIKYQLAALIGEGPDAAEKISPPQISFIALPRLPENLPAELAGHRPDIVAMIWNVEAASQKIKVAKADFYPNINLLAAIGRSSIGWAHLFFDDAQNGFIGPAITLPLFHGGAITGHLRSSTAEYDEAVERYNQTVIQAFSSIASLASKLKFLEAQSVENATAIRLAQKAYNIANKGYRSGLTDYLNVLTMETALLAAEESDVTVAADRLDTYAQLMQELGGGFRATPEGKRAFVNIPNPRSPAGASNSSYGYTYPNIIKDTP